MAITTFTVQQTPKPKNLELIPNAVGCHTGLSKFGAITNWQCIDEDLNAFDEDNSYVYSSATTPCYDLYALPNHTTETGTINHIRTFTRAKSHMYAQSSSGIYKILLTENACTNIYKSSDMDLTTGYLNYNSVWKTNPRTAVNWTWADIDNLQVGTECSSPTVQNAHYSVTLNDDGNSIYEWDGGGSGSWMGSYWFACYGTCGTCEGTAGNKKNYRTFDNTALTAAYAITNVTLVARFTTDIGKDSYPCNPIGGCYSCSNEDPKAKLMITTHATDYQGSDFYIYYKAGLWQTETASWTKNPNTAADWTWAEVNDLIGGCYAYNFADTDFCGANHVMSRDIHFVVDYLGDVNPEIRTTQVYTQVNYTPPDSYCYLTRPNQISRDHTRNVKMLNFWNGDREVYGLSRTSKTMVLMGAEHGSAACDRILCIRTMGKDGSIITVSQLGFAEFNGEFRIKQFGWKKVSEKPLHFTWILELEDAVL